MRVGGGLLDSYPSRMGYEETLEQKRRDVGMRMKQAREASGLSQADVARLMGEHIGEQVPPSRIGNYEQGKRMPNHFDMQIIATVCGVSVAVLYGFPDTALGEDERTLLHKYRQTDERGKRAIHSVAESQPEFLTSPDRMDKAIGE